MPQEYKAQGDDFEIYFTWFGDYLLARVEGLTDSLGTTVAYWSMVAAECRRRGAKRLLVVENLKGEIGEVPAEEIFQKLIVLGFEGIKIAFVDRSETRWSVQEQVSLMAREHGITGRVFTQERDAVTWLRHGID